MTWHGGPRPALDEREQERVVALMEWRRRRRDAGAVILMDDIECQFRVSKRTLYRYVARHRRATTNTE